MQKLDVDKSLYRWDNASFFFLFSLPGIDNKYRKDVKKKEDLLFEEDNMHFLLGGRLSLTTNSMYNL